MKQRTKKKKSILGLFFLSVLSVIGILNLIIAFAFLLSCIINRDSSDVVITVIFLIVGLLFLLPFLRGIKKRKSARRQSSADTELSVRDYRAPSQIPVPPGENAALESCNEPIHKARSRLDQPAIQAEPASTPVLSLSSGYYDELLPQAVEVIFETNQASVSMLQRRLNLGYSRAARLIDQLEEVGIVGPQVGTKPRDIIITKQVWQELINAGFQFESPAASTEPSIDFDQIIRDEENWRREQRGLSPLEDELYKIDHMEGHAFEQWCADLLRKNGFYEVEVTQASNDQGVDVLAVKGGVRYAIQCKCYSKDLGNTPIQEVHAGKSFYGCHVGAVMTNRYFTAGAKELAAKTRVFLWGRDKIIEMIKAAE